MKEVCRKSYINYENINLFFAHNKYLFYPKRNPVEINCVDVNENHHHIQYITHHYTFTDNALSIIQKWHHHHPTRSGHSLGHFHQKVNGKNGAKGCLSVVFTKIEMYCTSSNGKYSLLYYHRFVVTGFRFSKIWDDTTISIVTPNAICSNINRCSHSPTAYITTTSIHTGKEVKLGSN